ncbi:MAG: hypothetical protein KJ607_09325 [Bacteroidetes bacterium]|nr:hypothetical protein [Bacteroidota bacterium]
MTKFNYFFNALTHGEKQIIRTLNTPVKIQGFLDKIPYSSEPVYRCPLRVIHDRLAHCFDGALFAAAALYLNGYPPLILDMIPNDRDDDHLLALFKHDGYWGAVAKSNFSGLRYREPVFRNLRELVLSYFEQYYNVAGEKTLRGYTVPLNLIRYDKSGWMVNNETMDVIAQRLDEIRRYSLLTPKMIAGLAAVDERLYNAGLSGADKSGLFRPPGDW